MYADRQSANVIISPAAGSSGKIFKVGSKYNGTANRTGNLYFAIAMNPQFAGQGYNFPGKYPASNSSR